MTACLRYGEIEPILGICRDRNFKPRFRIKLLGYSIFRNNIRSGRTWQAIGRFSRRFTVTRGDGDLILSGSQALIARDPITTLGYQSSRFDIRRGEFDDAIVEGCTLELYFTQNGKPIVPTSTAYDNQQKQNGEETDSQKILLFIERLPLINLEFANRRPAGEFLNF